MKKNKSFRNFQDWHSYDVEQVFVIQQVNTLPALDHLMAIDLNKGVPESLQTFIRSIQRQLFRKHIEWNEAELNFQFIGPLLATIGFNGEQYASYVERQLSFRWQDETISGIVDFMVASGFYEPEQPYFFLHEYKRFKGTDANPLGQLLIAMIATQLFNIDQLPIYGCFVLGKYWSFVVLESKEYAVSKGYDATNEQELHIIWNILNHTKMIIETRVNANSIEK
jgi:hypothetical protein